MLLAPAAGSAMPPRGKAMASISQSHESKTFGPRIEAFYLSSQINGCPERVEVPPNLLPNGLSPSTRA